MESTPEIMIERSTVSSPPGRTIISVDGPAASGKSTIARGLAEALRFKYINSGALYRAIGYHLLQIGMEVKETPEFQSTIERLELDCCGDGYYVNGHDVSSHLATREVSNQASAVARLPRVREKVNRELRRLVAGARCVVEGRDIGTVVFPDSDLKVYLEASLEERARRRLSDYERVQPGRSLEDISQEIAERDTVDSTRAIAPLRAPDGAIVVNSTHMTPEEVIERVLTLFRQKVEGSEGPGTRRDGP